MKSVTNFTVKVKLFRTGLPVALFMQINPQDQDYVNYYHIIIKKDLTSSISYSIIVVKNTGGMTMTTQNMKRKCRRFADSIQVMNYNLESKYNGRIQVSVVDEKSSAVYNANNIIIYLTVKDNITGIVSTLMSGQTFKTHQKALNFCRDSLRMIEKFNKLF